MKSRVLIISVAFLIAAPGLASQPATSAVAESKQAHSTVSVLVDPQLNDGRLVVKVAAQNKSGAPVPFGPGSISVSKPNGEQIAQLPLARLIDDVRVAAGISARGGSVQAPTAGAYATPNIIAGSGGRPDVSTYTGGAGIAGNEVISRSNQRAPKSKPSISKEQAEAQTTMLRQAILQESTVPPGQVAAGQIVSQKLTFRKGEDRTLHLRIRIAGDEHAFTILAPTG
jgi:hypothetical protein